MSGHRPWAEIRKQAPDSPERRVALAEERRISDAMLTLHEMRKQRGASQEDLASAWETSQANVSPNEHDDGLFVSSIRRYVEALGGKLELRAVFPDQAIELSFDQMAPQPVQPSCMDEPVDEHTVATGSPHT